MERTATSTDRRPAVAGRFYPADPNTLARTVAEYCEVDDATPEPALAVIGPHAGYPFSGPTAGRVYGRVTVPDTAIVLGPNHTGMGRPLALIDEGRWMMPMGPVSIDEVVAASVRDRIAGIEVDRLAHLREHGIETHVPFLQHRRSGVQLVPLVTSRQSRAECERIGKALAAIVAESDDPSSVLLVSSTDMSHFISATRAAKLDQMAIDKMLALDPDGLYDTVAEHGITMCGVVPTTIILHAALELGAREAELVDYTHSGVVTGDYDSVVGYAGLIVR